MGETERGRRVMRPGREALATLIEHVNEHARVARNGQIAFAVMLGLAYALLFSITHRQLFLNEAVRLPLLNLAVPLNLFFFVLPILVMLLHFALLQRHVVLAGQLQTLARRVDFSRVRHEPLLSGNFFVQRRVGGNAGAFSKRYCGCVNGCCSTACRVRCCSCCSGAFCPFMLKALSGGSAACC